ncbi:MAG: UDP-N-acetylglucosamine-peptide N-acetylglucosaminyltransferase, partial [Gammaproteobacteria bacterium]|nr:UDP-N-acetylglucosamine-peptide N-acetylglucosaminyltransferase [Gammaproteobacteria bacterium]
RAIGLPELITTSMQDYERLAIELGRDPARLAALRAKLAVHRESAELFDTARFTRNLEKAYLRMSDVHRRGEQPRHFTVD